MWGLSGVAGQFKRTINAVASEIKDAVEEVVVWPLEAYCIHETLPLSLQQDAMTPSDRFPCSHR